MSYSYINKRSLWISLQQNSHYSQRCFLYEIIKRRRITSHIQSLTIVFPLGRNHQLFQSTILDYIKSCKRLQQLSLEFNPCYRFCPEMLQTIHKALRLSRGLRKFQLNLTICDLTPEQLNEVASFISKLHFFAPKVIDFKITWRFFPRSSIRPPLADNPFSKMTKGFKFLTSLTLELSTLFFEGPRAQGNAFDFSSLKALRNLRDLDLIFHEREEASTVLQHNAHILPYKSFRKLRHLKITIHEGSVPISLASQMAANLSKLKNLSLALIYSQYSKKSLSEKELKKLTADLSLGIKHLASLSLKLPKITFTTSTVSSLSSLLLCEEFHSLQTLSLNFPKSKNFSNFAMEKLGESISKNLRNLKNLSFSLTVAKISSNLITKTLRVIFHRDDFSDEGLVQFGNALTQKTTGLEYLRLQIEKCPQISDEGVKGFCGKFGLIKNLKGVNLSFKECEKVTVEPRNYYYYYNFH